MSNRIATLAICALVAVGTAPLASAEPDPVPVVPVADTVAPLPPPGPVPSSPPGVLNTPDGWTVTVLGKDESQLPVAPLTTALSSREYLVGGTFSGSVKGGGDTTLAGGTLEAGYQIGCGIMADTVEMIGTASLSPSIKIPFTSAASSPFGTGITGQIKVALKPGTVTIVPVGKKSFKGSEPRITITNFRVKIDSCAGQSFIRSYATLTSSTENTDDVITYIGVTKVV